MGTSGRVYPRTCGGTLRRTGTGQHATGLSPHVRGNRGARRGRGHREGSIPARAGEPSTPTITAATTGVYPRTCGGTFVGLLTVARLWGLSPHVRGNRQRRQSTSPGSGSIPARAGEPIGRWRAPVVRWVYPRTCGGTAPRGCDAGDPEGLSPHVRGNLRALKSVHLAFGSIPARAGEPASVCFRLCLPWVYPRTCGGTTRGTHGWRRGMGLSPHVRGNPERSRGSLRDFGSIPARAGEPPCPAGAAA